MIQLKRIYEQPSNDDGYRILVDKLWPRGISKEDAQLDLWLKEVAPSDELRKWFNHEDEKWKEFKARYREELKNREAFETLKEKVKEQKKVTLLYAAKNEKHNNAVALKEFLG